VPRRALLVVSILVTLSLPACGGGEARLSDAAASAAADATPILLDAGRPFGGDAGPAAADASVGTAASDGGSSPDLGVLFASDGGSDLDAGGSPADSGLIGSADGGPHDASGGAADAGPGDGSIACEVFGAPGECIDVSACAALGDHSSYPNHCPGPASIECCIKTPSTADDPPIPAGWKLMQQSAVTPDMTTWAVAILHDPVTYPMFSTTIRVFGMLMVLARVEWHPPDFQNGVVHRGVTLYQPI
jgi:hypothetical protein